MTGYIKSDKILGMVVLAFLLSGCLGFNPPSDDRKGYFQKKEFIFRSLGLEMSVVETTPILLADITIENPTDYLIQDLLLTCDEFSTGGNRLARHNPLVNQVLQQKSQQTFRRVEIGDSHQKFATLRCEVTDFEIVPIEPIVEPSGTGLVQKLGTRLDEMKSRSHEEMIDEEKKLPNVIPRRLPEQKNPERKDSQHSGPRSAVDRLSSQQKAGLVLRLLRGESLESVSRDSRVSVYDLERWQQMFLEEGTRGLENRK